jgi:hypothetical protein
MKTIEIVLTGAALIALVIYIIRSQFDRCECGHRRFDHFGKGGYSFCLECAARWRDGLAGCRHGRYSAPEGD